MYYMIYKIINNTNGKIYIGKHQTHNLDDGYMGSGKHLCYSISKYGIENFAKEILHVFTTEDEMNAKEKELVTEEFCSRLNTYNICEGGHGGFGYINKNGLSDYSSNGKKGNIRKQWLLNNDINYRQKFRRAVSLANKKRKYKGSPPTFLGKKHSEKTKEQMSFKAKERLKDPTQNTQYGTMWITNGTINKKIKKIDKIPEEWYNGRVINICVSEGNR